MSTTLHEKVRAHIASEVKLLSWIQSDATGNEPLEEVAFSDLDSFSFVQLVLSLESEHDVELLERLGEFSGTSFDDLTDFIVARITEHEGASHAG